MRLKMNRKLISSGSEFESKIGYSRAVLDGDYDPDTDSRLVSPTVSLPAVSGAV